MMAVGVAVPMLLILFVHTLLGSCAGQPQLRLELASVVHRHGDRSPVHPYPNDPIPESVWPQGLGQLSVHGMQQEYHLGLLLKERYVTTTYKDFLFENYTRVQVYVRSTDYDRTLMSAESLLAALFPPKDEQVFNPDIQWQPIPVHTVPVSEDQLLRGYDIDCPRYQQLREEDKTSQQYKEMEAKYQELLAMVKRETGLEELDISNAWQVYDTLYTQNISGYGFPDWATPEVVEQLSDINDFGFVEMFNSVEKKRLTSGPWLQKVLSDMLQKASGGSELADSKLFLYSAHDTTVTCELSGLGVFNGIAPPYASALLMELLRDQNDVYYVKVFYRNNTFTNDTHELTLPGCDSPCTLDDFMNYVEPFIPSDWEAECGLTSGASGTNVAAAVLGSLFGATVVLIPTVVAIALCYWTRTRRRRRSARLSKEVPYAGFAGESDSAPEEELP